MFKSARSAALVGLLVLLMPTLILAAEPPVLSSFEAAKEVSEKKGRPVLLRIGKGWCTSCNRFDQAIESNAAFLKAIQKNAVLCAINVKEGEGADVSRMYSVGYYGLSFILTNSQGELMDRWDGYHDEESFLEHLTSAVENPITIHERMARFEENASEIDARKLGEIRHYAGYFAEGIAYYKRAQALNPFSDINYDLLILNAMAKASYGNLFTLDDVRNQADVVVASVRTTPKEHLKVAHLMGKVAKKSGDVAYFVPYLETAIEKTAAVDDEGVREVRAKLLPQYALHVEKNEAEAVRLQKAVFSGNQEDWLYHASSLNKFAWWCFENEINLEEAESFARKGVELATPGKMKANVLDTLAEICNLKGDCRNAVVYIQQAVAEAPEEEYFQKQLVRFEKMLAALNE